jgi:aryl-alcohol dehydrogenase-like predicted oxidoreductase
MDYRLLGRTGVHVSKLCLGTMMFGAWGNSDHDDSIRIIQRALDAGINFIDTADVYSAGESEEIVGKALKGRRDDVVLATKVSVPMDENPNHRGNSRRWIITEVENSLRRLGTDWIDLYQIHRPDPDTDIDETLGALSDLVAQGKVRYIGSSSFSAGQIVEAQWTARDRRLERFRTEQPPYSLLVRGIELDVLPTAQRHGMGILTYSPLAGGWLSGRWTADSSPTSPARQRLAARFDMALPENQRKLEAVRQLAQVADEAGVSLIELAIAFVIEHPAVTSAIIGPRTTEQLDSQAPAADVVLDTPVLDRIDEIIKPGVNLNPADTSYGEQVLTARRASPLATPASKLSSSNDNGLPPLSLRATASSRVRCGSRRGLGRPRPDPKGTRRGPRSHQPPQRGPGRCLARARPRRRMAPLRPFPPRGAAGRSRRRPRRADPGDRDRRGRSLGIGSPGAAAWTCRRSPQPRSGCPGAAEVAAGSASRRRCNARRGVARALPTTPPGGCRALRRASARAGDHRVPRR